jgi:hypothetical protein
MKPISLEREYQFVVTERHSEAIATLQAIYSGLLVLPFVPVGEFYTSE